MSTTLVLLVLGGLLAVGLFIVSPWKTLAYDHRVHLSWPDIPPRLKIV